jgi:predicted RND superfamily exporter protein
MDAIHLYDAVRRLSAAGEPDPVGQATRDLRAPCLVTMLGTIGSLAAFALPGAPPLLRAFGLWGAAGSAVAYVLTFVVGASLLRLTARSEEPPRWPVRLVRRSMVWSQRHPWLVLGVWLAAIAGSAVQLRELRVAAKFPHVFAAGDPVERELVAASAMLDADLSPVELYVEATTDSGRRPGALLAATLGLGRYLETLPETRASLSVGLLVEELLRTDRRARALLARAWLTGGLGEQARALARDPRLGRWVRLDDGVARVQVLFSPMSYGRREEILGWLRHYDATMMSSHRIRFGGSGYVYHAAEREGVRSLAVGAAAEVLFFATILGFALARPRLVAVALVGNVLPVLVLAGLMAMLDVPWSLGLLGLPVVVLGLAVDDTVHVLWPLRSRSDLRVGTALAQSARHSGAAILAAAAVLAFCLATLSVSRFQANRELGLLFPVGLGLAALAELTLVPALLRVWRRRSARRRR